MHEAETMGHLLVSNGYNRSWKGLKPTRFTHSWMYLQQKNIQGQKPKICEYTGMKIIIKHFFNASAYGCRHQNYDGRSFEK
jgi:hypothetical protein